MVSLLRKLFLATLVAVYTASSAWASIEINDSGTWRFIDQIKVNDSGTWRQIKQVQVNDSGTWRSVYQADIFDVTVESFTFACDPFCGYSIPSASNIGSISPNGNISIISSSPTAIVNSILSSQVGGSQSFTFIACSEGTAPTVNSIRKILVYYDIEGDDDIYHDFPVSSASFSVATDAGGDACNVIGYSHRATWGWAGLAPWLNPHTTHTFKVFIVK